MPKNLNKKSFINYHIYYILLYLLLQKIKCNENTYNLYFNKNSSFYEIYRIDTFVKNLTLTYKNERLEFSYFNNLNNHFRIYLSEIKPFYYIELKSEALKIGINDKNEAFLYSKDEIFPNMTNILWEIIEISPSQYIIKNIYNKNYLEKYYKIVKCDKNYFDLNSKKEFFKFTFIKLFDEAEYKKEYLEEIKKEPIDIVIKYIDLFDKALNRTGIIQDKKDEENEELRYSVRSIFTYLPWFRKIYIIMPNEKVRYFKPKDEIKDKIIYIKDKDLIGFDASNIQAFLFNLFKLDKFGVSENFIYMDDDYFIGQPLNKSDFFYFDERDKKVRPCIINYYFNELKVQKSKSTYNDLLSQKDKIHPLSYKGWKLSLASTEKFLFNNYNNSYFIYTEYTQNAIPMNIYDIKEIFNEVQKYEYIKETIFSVQKHILSLSFNYLYNLYNLNIKHRKVHSISNKYITFQEIKYYEMFYPLFVINTPFSKKLTETQIQKGLKLIKYRFPYPTRYEIITEDMGSNIVYVNEKGEENNNLKNATNLKKKDKESDIFSEKGTKTKNKIYNFIKRFYIIFCLLIIIIVFFCFLRAKEKKDAPTYAQIYNDD